MRSVFIFLGGFFTAILVVTVGGYAAIQYYTNIAEEYQAEWIPDFDKQLYKSTAELAAAKTEYERWVALGDVGFWNVDHGSLDRAEELANLTLKIAEKYKKDWNYGNALHKGHLTLGRIALRKNNIEEAKKQLLLAGHTPGSPQLNSFGPNMLLAKELLEKGEKEVVIKYLKLCEKFWDLHIERLTRWQEQVSSGVSPSFGANLLY